MKIHVDEDIAAAVLVRLLQHAGHDVMAPTNAGTLGRSDAVQLTTAIHESRAFLTSNYEDFEELHWLIREAAGSHCGILVVRRDNDPSRDLTHKGIVAAIRKLEAAGVPIENEYTILNQWR